MGLRPLFAAAVSTLAMALPAAVQAQDLNAETAASIMRGAQLYDKWWAVTKGAEPADTHPAYVADTGREGSQTWRCKECHGWDYIGDKGRYSEGSHYTGIMGVSGVAGGDPTEIAAAIRGEPHGFGADLLDDQSVADLANFLAQGQIDMSPYIADGMSTGNAEAGGAVYVAVCAGCHGADGTKITEMPPLGEISENPQESMHKILFGQPAEAMPGLMPFGPQVAADIIAYMHTLPK